MKKTIFNPEDLDNKITPMDVSNVSYFGHSYKYQVNCHDINHTIIFTNDHKNSERVSKIARPHGATLIEFELFD